MSLAIVEIGVILIVDDNPNNLEVLSEALMDTGWEILVAVNGEGAIAQAEYAHPDIILLDVMMPGIDGFTTCDRLKSNPITADIPIIFMTALSETVNKVKGLNLGAVDYITKPCDQQEVLARVQTHLKIRHLTKQLQTQNQQLQQEVAERLLAEAKLQSLTQDLEQRVEERTSQLSHALSHLQQTQVNLVQREKMSALGELVAGIAHEINNPVNFILGNLGHASEYTQSFIELLNLYQKYYPEPVDEIADKIDEIDLNYLICDFPEIILSMHKGTKRMAQMIRALRHFSRRDDASAEPTNIHEGIDSTLLILQYRLKANPERPAIQIIKEYNTLPLVECFPGPLNQVFMNILANAIDAIEESFAKSNSSLVEYTGKITIRTSVIEQRSVVIIQIADNGIGMTQAVQQGLSEPMFTTKPVGKGTGLGLSISRQIIEEQHQGAISFVSELGKGTEFSIEIPLVRS
ncbi:MULTISPECIES: hybrid sensor histidine kinase/response regulator [unclassified Tolypothrix]|uniref:hybrid sensor histidine kinase/response regulator n=1 Tax=unclassified Tolypothrix TaxID=2649714 RepID=UPI0005EAAE5F|nr:MULTISPECIES: response regulator [unclassified Tolypothrix]BAY90393.1 response regulator receiver sensor signal transduction histidine kinase [Microchaete diplosiphon NIES-3275]EKE98701.1 sensor histidine kinase [Tolypothrix sp. PCC 7601]MBE9087872.1 response regulator [Tolypothrix sp. LEGE 11397]UYD24570.1 response regulator [Tolypothrix sp. PCC 7712]UYD33201.1 response regulator [Tolypothrix sp. PCC 7601]